MFSLSFADFGDGGVGNWIIGSIHSIDWWHNLSLWKCTHELRLLRGMCHIAVRKEGQRQRLLLAHKELCKSYSCSSSQWL